MTLSRILMASCLAFSLVGCQAPMTSQVIQAPEATLAAGHLQLTINWPTRLQGGYEVAAIPNRTQAFRLTVLKGGVPIGEPRTFLRPDSASATASLRIELPAGQGYVLQAKAYDSETEFDEAHLVAEGSSAPFAIQSGRRTPVALSMTVTNAPQLDDSQIPDGAGRLAELTLVGANFGADPSAIRATLTLGTQEPKPVEILELVSSTRLRVKLPDTATIGSAVLKVFVDGVASNALPMAIISSLEVDSTFAKRQSYGQPYYVPAGEPLARPVRGRAYVDNTWKSLDDLAMTCTVTKGGSDVTASVVDAQGRLSLPAGTYTVTYASGAEQATMTVIAAPLHWNSASLGTLRVAPYYIPGTASPGFNEPSKGVDMSGFYFDAGTGVFLEPEDFTWASNPAGVVSFELPYYYNQRMILGAGEQTGAATVTGTFKYDPSRTLSLQAINVRIQGFTFQRAADPKAYPLTWSGTVSGALSLKVGQKAVIRVGTVDLTDGTSVSVGEDFDFGSRVEAESRMADGSSGSAVAAVSESFGEATITAVAPGQVNLRVWHRDDPVRATLLPVTITN